MHITSRQLTQILGSRKTQMRLPIREPRTQTRRNGTTYTTKPFTPAAGRNMTLRASTSTDATRVTITEVRSEQLGDITFPDVMAEGHTTTSGFQVWWVHAHDRPWVTKRLEDNQTLPDELLIDRFTARHADTVVWAVRFVIDPTERPRLMVPAGRRFGDERGYTDNPAGAMDEADAVDDRWLQKFADEAKEADRARALERPIEWRLRQALADAEHAGIDVTRQVLAIEQRIRSIRLRAQQRAA